MLTEVPMSKCKYLFTILARISSPPVEALMLNIKACEAESNSTKQQRSNHGSPITEGVPVTGLALAMPCHGYIQSQKSVNGPKIKAVYTVLAPNSLPINKKAKISKTILIPIIHVPKLPPKILQSTMLKPEMVPIMSLLGTRK